MEKKTLKKLSLKKETVSALTPLGQMEQNQLRGGWLTSIINPCSVTLGYLVDMLCCKSGATGFNCTITGPYCSE